MKGIVLDSSILLTWFTSPEESKANKSRKVVLENFDQLYSHNLLRYEMNNGLVFSVSDRNSIEKLYANFEDLPITCIDLTSNEFKLARDISMMVNDSTYDTSYHALALTKNLEFVTCDKRYFRKAKDFGNIRLIA